MKHLISLAPLLLASTLAFADSSSSSGYSVDLSRVQFDMNCTVSKANGGSSKCSITFDTQGDITLSMVAEQDPAKGYSGLDTINDNGAVYLLGVAADSTKTVQSVTLARIEASSDGKSKLAFLTSTASNSLNAVNVGPLSVQTIDDQTIQVISTVVVYGPTSNQGLMNPRDRQPLMNFVLEKLRPVIQQIAR